ncbi:hypothetical protein, partial [Salmonella enterica]|uniref:hypothetical protein n=1 Tax=Salmonella enterica TaxID=28901 RepID=UPI00329A18AE
PGGLRAGRPPKTAVHQINQRAQSKDLAILRLSLYGKSYRVMTPTRFKHLRRVDKNRLVNVISRNISA